MAVPSYAPMPQMPLMAGVIFYGMIALAVVFAVVFALRLWSLPRKR